MIENKPRTGYTGTVKDGVIIPDEPLNLPDGAKVEIELTPRQRLERLIGVFKDDPYWERFQNEVAASRTTSPGLDIWP